MPRELSHVPTFAPARLNPWSTRSKWRFFMQHAGYATPPGRVAYAMSLAVAESLGEQTGLTVTWDNEQDVDVSWMDAEQLADYQAGDIVMLAAVCRDASGAVLASCGNISLTGSWEDDPYRRVMDAELMAEALTRAPSCPTCGDTGRISDDIPCINPSHLTGN